MRSAEAHRQVVLLQARTLLIAGAESAAAVAFEVGYESASQFSREYARFFGLPPARDALKVQVEPGRVS